MKVECTICETIFEEDDLEFLGKRCDRHAQGRHEEHRVISERDGHIVNGHGMGNLIFGITEWITHD